MLKTKKSVVVLSGIIYVIITLLGLIGLFFNMWEIVMILGISSIFSFCHLLICLFYNVNPPTSNQNNTLRMFLLIAFRGLFSVLSIIIPLIILLFVPNSSLDYMGKYRVLLFFISFVPMAISLVMFYIGSSKE